MKFLKIIGFVFFLIIVVSVATLFFRSDLTIPKEQVVAELQLPESKFIDWKGNKIHYLEAGQGTTILMVHGLGGSVYDFYSLFNLLKEDYHVVAVDLPGFSLSDKPNINDFEHGDYLMLYKEFVAYFLDELNLNSFHLIGNSMGGWISWETAIDHNDKVKTLTLLGAAGYEMDEVAENATGWLKNPVVELILAKGLPNNITLKNLEFCYFDDNLITNNQIDRRNKIANKEGNLAWMKELALAKVVADTSKISSIQTPTLIVWGDSDEIIPTNHCHKFHRDIENSKLLLYENCGHVPQMEMTERLYADFLSFIE